MSLATVLLAVAIIAPVTPHTGAACYAAPSQLGTGNITSDVRKLNDHSTDVINIWAFVKLDDSNAAPVAWLYKNRSGHEYVKFNDNSIDLVNATLRDAGLKVGTNKYGIHDLVAVNDTRLVDVENALLAVGVSRVGCFTSDLR